MHWLLQSICPIRPQLSGSQSLKSYKIIRRYRLNNNSHDGPPQQLPNKTSAIETYARCLWDGPQKTERFRTSFCQRWTHEIAAKERVYWLFPVATQFLLYHHHDTLGPPPLHPSQTVKECKYCSCDYMIPSSMIVHGQCRAFNCPHPKHPQSPDPRCSLCKGWC